MQEIDSELQSCCCHALLTLSNARLLEQSHLWASSRRPAEKGENSVQEIISAIKAEMVLSMGSPHHVVMAACSSAMRTPLW